jgi:phage tail sheath protein FI
MPGINITTSVRTGPSNTTVRESSQAFFAGFAERGPIDEAVKVTSMEEFERVFGGYVSTYYLHPTVEAFFEEGGSQCYIARIGFTSSGTVSTKTLNRTATISGIASGTPAAGSVEYTTTAAHGFAVGDSVTITGLSPSGYNNTFTITSVGSATTFAVTNTTTTSPTDQDGTATAGSIVLTANGYGAWGNDLAVAVSSGTIAGTVNISLYYDDTLLMSTGNVSTVDQAIGKINSNLIAKNYVVASAEGDTDNVPSTLVLASGGFAGGANGSDGGASQVGTALDLFVSSYGTGAVSCPESASGGVFAGTTSAVGTVPQLVIDHAVETNRVAILHTHSGVSIADAQDIAEYTTANATDGLGLERTAMYYPWVYAPTTTAGVNRLIPPDGYVCGVRARAHNTTGQHQPGAGIYSTARFIVGLEREVGKTSADALDTASLNVIRIINNSIRVYGARCMSSDIDNWRYLNAVEVVNYVVVESERALEDLLFSTIDGRNKVFADVQARLTGLLEPLRLQGALYEAFDTNGKRVDHGYTIKCDTSLNPVTNLKDGIVTARVGLRPAGVTDTIEVDIVKSNLTASVV